MMAFTDDDLKRAKENINDPYVQALLARLEAAENFIEVGALSQGVSIAKLAVAELKWRKAAGK